MKILCTSQIGSSTVLGQTMRVIAIAKALQQRGAQVKYLAGGKLIPVVQSHGIKIIPLPPMPEIELFPDSEQMKDQRYQEKMAVQTANCFQLSQNSEKETIAADRPDLMLCGSPLSTLTAKEAKIPAVLTMLQPHGKKTFAYFEQKMQDRKNLNHILENRMCLPNGKLSGGDFQQSFLQALDVIGLIFLEGMPEISGGMDLDEISSHFGTKTDLFQKVKPKIRFTGPLLAEMPGNFPTQEELKLRYTGHPSQPLVYVTIGGGTALIGEEFLHLVLEAFRLLPEVNGVVSTGLAIAEEKIAGY
ncbi:MAG TPA: hypothetical protein DDW50_19335, partial [Firmicutes bacterium]|nr:hypothetical protein [Bacillota bacterium]